MILSIIIVNYNVKFFLEQCLCSVQRAVERMEGGYRDTEVIIIDNHSGDGSLEYLEPRYPWAKFVSSKENLGYAIANNQGLALSRGRYVLFLNPDTIIGEDALHACVQFLDIHPEAGALGVQMLDGRGRFLKESVRGFPTPWAAFCKFSGLTNIFPASSLFASYYMGSLKKSGEPQVEVLSGACMMVTREAIKKTGGFDERFFMYAEDIDLSYRIRKAGFLNYYLSKVSILHFKGESTRKDPRYARYFYRTMHQFMEKYPEDYSGVLLSFLRMAIWIRGGLSGLFYTLPEKPASAPLSGTPVFITGDPGSAVETKTCLRSSGYRITEDPAKSRRTVFCEGPAFSFAQIIQRLKEADGHVSCRIHGLHTGSIVGSDAASSRGETIIC
jgi:GT2 family glycosyltransferase